MLEKICGGVHVIKSWSANFTNYRMCEQSLKRKIHVHYRQDFLFKITNEETRNTLVQHSGIFIANFEQTLNMA